MRTKFGLKRLMALLLATLMLLSATAVFAGCSSGDEDGASTTGAGAGSGETQTDAETKDTPYANMEKTKYGRDFVILNRSDLKSDFEGVSDDGAASILSELLVDRNTVVSEDFRINFVYLYEDDYTGVHEKVGSQALNTLDEYDIAIGHKYSFNTCALNNYLKDLSTIEALSLEDEWWDQGCRKSLAINGKTYLMTGDILPSSMLISACMVFNKRILKELGKQEPYTLVRDAKWTLDEFIAMTKDVTADTDGDGTLTYDKDRFGLSSWMMDVPFTLYYGAGGMFGAIDEDGGLTLDYETVDVVNRYEKIYNVLIEQQAYFVTDLSKYETSYECFATGHALFYDTSLNKVRNFLSDMSDDYGIVPIPKYDTLQKEYLSFVNGATGFVMIISSESDPEYVGSILEAMARYNYENVSTNMFEIVTKLQSVRDQDSSEMVEYIIRNRVYDFAYFLDLDIANVVLNQLQAGKKEINSQLRQAGRSSERRLATILRDMEKNQKSA